MKPEFTEEQAITILRHTLWSVDRLVIEAQFQGASPDTTLRLVGKSDGGCIAELTFRFATPNVLSFISEAASDKTKRQNRREYQTLLTPIFLEEPIAVLSC